MVGQTRHRARVSELRMVHLSARAHAQCSLQTSTGPFPWTTLVVAGATRHPLFPHPLLWPAPQQHLLLLSLWSPRTLTLSVPASRALWHVLRGQHAHMATDGTNQAVCPWEDPWGSPGWCLTRPGPSKWLRIGAHQGNLTVKLKQSIMKAGGKC